MDQSLSCKRERATTRAVRSPRLLRLWGIWILDPESKKLVRVVRGQPQTTNIAFGRRDWKTLYFTNWNFLDSVHLRIAGMPVSGS